MHRHAAIWRGKKLVDLGALGGTDSAAAAINDKDEIVGTFIDATGTHPFLYSGGKMVALEPLLGAGGAHFTPTGINNAGVIIGRDGSGQGMQAKPLVP